MFSHKTTIALSIPLTLACNVEQAIQDLIDEHGVTWDTTTTDSTGSVTPTGGEEFPTTSGGMGASEGAGGSSSTGSNSSTDFDADTSTGNPIDQPPVLDFKGIPAEIKTAKFVDLVATCEDDIGVKEVRFLVDGTPIASVQDPPFEAKWTVKATDEDGPRVLVAECEDSGGNVVSQEHPTMVKLPESGTEAWSKLFPSKNWSTEALDASAASDGSWWVCGYDSDGGIGGAVSMWVAHFGPDGTILFNQLISRGPGFSGTCAGIEAFPDDPHRAALTGTWVKDWVSPLLWTGVVDDTQDPFVIAKNEDNYLGEVGNDVTVTADHEVRITGYRIAGSNSILMYRAFTFQEGQADLAHFAADEYDSDVVDGQDAGEAIVALPDGRSLIAGRAVHKDWKKPRGIVAMVSTGHQIVKDAEGGWPLVSSLTEVEEDGFNDLNVTPDGIVAVAGWWKEDNKARRPRLVNFSIGDPSMIESYTQPAVGSDFIGQSLARLSSGPVMVAATKSDPVEKEDIWIEQYSESGWSVDVADTVWPKSFAGFFHDSDAPRAIRINALDHILVVGFETIQTFKNGKLVTVRQAWLRAFNG